MVTVEIMNKTPQLTPEQQKRFRHWLVKRRLYSSYQKACKATDSHIRIHKVFLQVIGFCDFFETEEIDDILLAYEIYPREQVNCGSDLITEQLNCTHNKVLPLVMENNLIANQTHKKVRGKQKSPTMKHYRTRLPTDMLDRLNTLDGPVSEHIRLAINQYLDLIDTKEQHDNFTV